MRLGFVGLGAMGRNVALNLLRAGFETTVYDIRPEACDPLVAKGARRAASPADVLAHSDIVGTMVFGPREIEAVVRGRDGFLNGEIAGKTWIDLTTSSPKAMSALAADFEARGGRAISAPVTGSVDSAIRGDMLLFVGGDAAAIEAARPALEAMGEIRRVGVYANGYVAKLVNNQIWKIHAAAIGEAMVVAKRAGLEPEVWWNAMLGGAADSFVLRHDVPSIFAGHYDPSFPIALCLKDLGLIQELIDETGVRHELTAATYARFREAKARFGETAGEMTVCKLLEDDAGVQLRVEGDWPPPWEAKHPSEVAG